MCSQVKKIEIQFYIYLEIMKYEFFAAGSSTMLLYIRRLRLPTSLYYTKFWLAPKIISQYGTQLKKYNEKSIIINDLNHIFIISCYNNFYRNFFRELLVFYFHQASQIWHEFVLTQIHYYSFLNFSQLISHDDNSFAFFYSDNKVNKIALNHNAKGKYLRTFSTSLETIFLMNIYFRSIICSVLT